MTVVRWLLRIVVAIVVLAGAIFIGARFHDGPLGPVPGGPLKYGTLVAEPVGDWTFAADIPEIEMQLDSQSTSRTTWILVHEGKAYIPCAVGFPPGKSWNYRAVEDGRATLRIAGKRYPVTLTKIDDESVGKAAREIVERKYPTRTPEGEAWLFHVTSRAGASS